MRNDKKIRTYAYVANETCAYIGAFLPRETVDGQPISKHGDYVAWTYGKKETLRRARLGKGYEARAAQAVQRLLGWGH